MMKANKNEFKLYYTIYEDGHSALFPNLKKLAHFENMSREIFGDGFKVVAIKKVKAPNHFLRWLYTE